MNSICSNSFQRLLKKTLKITKEGLFIRLTASVTLSLLSLMLANYASWAQVTSQVQVLSPKSPNTAKSRVINLNGVVLTLAGILQNKNVEVRVNAARALGGMGIQAKPAVPALVAALKDKQLRVRYSAAIALVNIGAELKTAFPYIIAALENESQFLRSDAASALANIGYNLQRKVSELSKSELEKIISDFDEALQIIEKFQSNSSRNNIRNIRTFRNVLQQERTRR